MAAFEKHARTVTLLTFISRVTGLARDAALARIFGVTATMDAFWLAFLVPNLFRRLFGEGALSAAFLPVFSQLDRDDPAVARQLATLTVSLLVIVLGGITLLGEGVLLALSARADHGHLAVWLMMVMLPYMPMVCLVAILGAMLQVRGRFGPTAAAPIILNLCLITAALMGGTLTAMVPAGNEGAGEVVHIGIVAASVIVAGTVQLAWSLLALRRAAPGSGAGARAGGGSWWAGPLRACRAGLEPLKRVLAQAGPMFVGLGILQINTFIDGLIASYPTTFGPTIFGYDFPLDPGALTALNNAQRLYEFPLGVFGIAIATAIFPALARVASRARGGDGASGARPGAGAKPGAVGDDEAFADILRRGLRLVVFIGLPASAGLVLVRRPLTAVILQGGDFTAADTQRVAFILLGYAPAIWAYSMTHVLTRASYARGDSMTPVKVAAGMVALNLALNLTLIWTPLKEAGLAWSTAMCAAVQVVVLLMLTRRYAAHVIDRAVMQSWLRTVAASGLMGAAVWLVASYLPDAMTSWSNAAISLTAMVVCGGVVMAAAAGALRMAELRWAVGRSD
jgi:putative peptidoglycan lipid II flippase